MLRAPVAALLALALVAAPLGADESVAIDAPAKKAIERGLVYLKGVQAPDGSWGRQNAAITAFGLLAFLANGHTPESGPYAANVERGVKFLLAIARDDGYLAGPGGGNMYSHGMATLALSQVYGMTPNDDVRKTLKRAVELIVKTQNREGGWRYEPAPQDADISATIMQVMALRGANDSGIAVPESTFKKAVAYIGRCQDPATGGYRYQPFSGGSGYARTAAGVCVLQLCGEYSAKPIGRAVEWLDESGGDSGHYWYGHYYAAHAYHQIGGRKWATYYSKMKTRLLAKQSSSGAWEQPEESGAGQGRVSYQTAIGVLVLSVPANYLPIYQR